MEPGQHHDPADGDLRQNHQEESEGRPPVPFEAIIQRRRRTERHDGERDEDGQHPVGELEKYPAVGKNSRDKAAKRGGPVGQGQPGSRVADVGPHRRQQEHQRPHPQEQAGIPLEGEGRRCADPVEGHHVVGQEEHEKPRGEMDGGEPNGEFEEDHRAAHHDLEEKKDDRRRGDGPRTAPIRPEPPIGQGEQGHRRHRREDPVEELQVDVQAERRQDLPVAERPVGTGQPRLQARDEIPPDEQKKEQTHGHPAEHRFFPFPAPAGRPAAPSTEQGIRKRPRNDEDEEKQGRKGEPPDEPVFVPKVHEEERDERCLQRGQEKGDDDE